MCVWVVLDVLARHQVCDWFGEEEGGAHAHLYYWAPLTRKRHVQHSPSTPTTGLRERGNDTSRSTGRSGRQNAATRRNMRREERVTAQGPVKEQQPDGMSHRGVLSGIEVCTEDCMSAGSAEDLKLPRFRVKAPYNWNPPI